MSILNDEAFALFMSGKGGGYQPIPLVGLYNPNAVRAAGCIQRWQDISKILPHDKPQKILDIGCNLGYFCIVAADSGHTVDGFDTDKEVIYWGKKIIEEFGIPGINLWVASDDLLSNLRKIPDDSYDYVFYLSVHHIITSVLGWGLIKLTKCLGKFQELLQIWFLIWGSLMK